MEVLARYIFWLWQMTLFIEIMGGMEIVTDTLSICLMKSNRLIALRLAKESYQWKTLLRAVQWSVCTSCKKAMKINIFSMNHWEESPACHTYFHASDSERDMAAVPTGAKHSARQSEVLCPSCSYSAFTIFHHPSREPLLLVLETPKIIKYTQAEANAIFQCSPPMAKPTHASAPRAIPSGLLW